MNKEFLTTPEVAERLNVSVRRVQQFINEGRLPSQQFGREHLIKEIDLAPFLTPRKAGRPRKEGAAEDEQASPPAQTRTTMTPAQKKRIRDEQQRRWKGGKK